MSVGVSACLTLSVSECLCCVPASVLESELMLCILFFLPLLCIVMLNFVDISLGRYKIVQAGTGKSHTVVITDDGNSLAFGWNKHGQLGSGSTKTGMFY